MEKSIGRRQFFGTSIKTIAGLSVGLSGCATLQSAPHGAKVYNVRAYGAVGDGKALDTDAINKAITAANGAGGGTVYFPPGTYLSASIHLKSNTTLYLEAGSVIEAVDDSIAPYDLPEPNEAGGNYQDYGHSHWHNSLMWGVGIENFSILGPGLIHGKGLNPGFDRFAENRYQDGGPGTANKAIALRECRNVTFRDFSILHGGHFGILATGVDNLTIDNLKVDTNRDGIDIDCCQNVRVSNCSINAPWDDALCLKASYGLGCIRHCDNITITNCYLAGNFDEGTMLDGTFKRSEPAYQSYRAGRIKLGTESNGDFKNITISNCVFDDCRGLCILSVDGSHIEDLTVSNITMRHVSYDPIFIRLGSRLRGPNNPPVGTIKRLIISNIVASDVISPYACTISAIPGHYIEDIRLSDLHFQHQGGGTKEMAERIPPENEANYPEPGMFGPNPAYGLFARHVKGLDVSHVKLEYDQPDARPAVVLSDVEDAYFESINAEPGVDNAPLFDLRATRDFSVARSRNIEDTKRPGFVEREKLYGSG